MPRIKPKRHTPRLDMTPMVDLAFLLVTFFMLTTKFRPQEAVTVDIPSSTTKIKPGEKNIITISISKDGRVFFDTDNTGFKRSKLLKRMGDTYGIQFTDEEANTFVNLGAFGVPVNQIKGWIAMKPDDRNKFKHPGIPTDSMHNELENWIVNARELNTEQYVLIKADKDAGYPVVKRVFDIIQGKPNVHTFNLITTLEAGPNDKTINKKP